MDSIGIKVEELSSISKKIKIEIPYKKVEEEFRKAFEDIAKKVVIKGFRKGKAPKSIIESKYKESARLEVTEKLINDSYVYFINKNKINPVGYPKISEVSELKEDMPFSYSAIIEVSPEVEVKDYKGIKVTTFDETPTEAEVNEVVANYLDSKAEMRTVEEDREVRNKDWLDIDLEGFLNNESRKDLTAKAYVCQVGDKKMLLDDLSSGIIGSKVGEEREVKAVYPSDYHIEDLKGKEITFKIKINKILDKITPELTDEIVKGEAKSKEEFINSIKENLEYNKKYARDNDIKTQIINALLEKNSFDVPSAEVERRLPEIRERMLRNMFGPNASKLPEANIKEILSKYADDMKKIAEREVKLSYIMNAIAKVEDINVTSEEVKQELEDMAKSMNTTATKLKAKYGEANIYSGLELTIIERKTFDYLIKEANISKKE